MRFFTRSGELTVTSEGEQYTLDFPQAIPSRITAPEGLFKALGLEENAGETWQASDLIVVIDDEDRLDALKPDFSALERFNTRGVVVTAASRTFDFRSTTVPERCGQNPSPDLHLLPPAGRTSGSEKLSKKTLRAQQGGSRKGELICHVKDNGRVELSGKACLMIEGTFIL